MIISLAAAEADFKTFKWYSAKQSFKMHLSDTPLTVQQDDLVGVRKTTRGPTAGSYQVVLAKYPQLVHRSVPESEIEKFEKHLKEFEGIPEKPKKTAGSRMAPINKRVLEQSDKQTSQFFKPSSAPREEGQYDKENYQWRKIVHPVRIDTKLGKVKTSLRLNDKIGMRYMQKSHGGFIILPNGERVQISHETYEQVTLNSDIVPSSEQERGIVDLKDVKKNAPNVRIRLPKAYAPPKIKEHKEGDTPQAKLPGDTVSRHKELVSKFHYNDLDDDFEFTPEEEEELFEPEEEFEEEPEETVKGKGKPAKEEEEPFPPEEEDHPEMDYQQDEPFDPETGEPIEDDEAIYAHEGLVLTNKNHEEWVVVSVEEAGLTDVLFLYNEKQNVVRHYKFPAGDDLRNSKTVTVTGSITGKKLERLQEKAADLDITAGKRI